MASMPVRKAALAFTRERITPTQATRWLENSNLARRRPLSQKAAATYANIMASGGWCVDTGEALKLGYNDEVVDGQHRLTAIIMSKKPQEMWVARGVPHEAFQYLDQGKTRDLIDLFAILGWPVPRITSVALRMLWRDSIKTGHPLTSPDAGAKIGDGGVADFAEKYKPAVTNIWDTLGTQMAKVQSMGLSASSVTLYIALKVMGNERNTTILTEALDFMPQWKQLGLASAGASLGAFTAALTATHKEYEDGEGRIRKGCNFDYTAAVLTLWTFYFQCARAGKRYKSEKAFIAAAKAEPYREMGKWS